MGEIELREPGYVAELIEVFNRAKSNAAGNSTTATLDGASTSSVITSNDFYNSRTTESLSEAASTFSNELPVLYSDYLQQSSSCQWSPEGHSDSAEHCSIDVFTTLRPKTKCACICNEKNCQFTKKPFSIEDDRSTPSDCQSKSSQLKKVFTLLKENKSFHQSYELPKTRPHSRWWKRRKTLENSLDDLEKPLTPTQPTPSHSVDEIDLIKPIRKLRTNGTNGSVPEIIEMNAIKRSKNYKPNTPLPSPPLPPPPPPLPPPLPVTSHEDTNGVLSHGRSHEELEEVSISGSRRRLAPKGRWPSILNFCRNCTSKPSPIRIVFLVLGTLLFLAGISYDFGVKHGVDRCLVSSWLGLLAEYKNFGNKFLSFSQMGLRTQMDTDGSAYIPFQDDALLMTKPEKFWNKVAEKDLRFVALLEDMEVSLQINFFNLIDSENSKETVTVKDIGPLFLKILFLRDRGFSVEIVKERSNMTLSTPFHVYDLMKMFQYSNKKPYYSFYMHDYYNTTPKALFSTVADVLKKFKISSSLMESFQKQSRKFKRRRRSNILKVSTWPSCENIIESTFLKIPVDRSKIVRIPVPFIDKNFTLRYEKEVRLDRIMNYQYNYETIIEDYRKSKYYSSSKWKSRNDIRSFGTTFQKKEPDPNLISTQFPMVVDLEPAIKRVMQDIGFESGMDKYPFWASAPHFLPRHEVNSFIPDSIYRKDHSISGMFPNDFKHGSFLRFHPILGVPTNASLAFQIGIRPPEEMLHAGRIVPVLWMRIQIEKIPSSLWYWFWFITNLRMILILFLTLSGVILISLAVVCQCKREPPPEMV